MITITETLYKKMPDDIKACFNQLPNPSSEEVRECFPETKSGNLNSTHKTGTKGLGIIQPRTKYNGEWGGDSGNASRFFKSIIYQPKASKSERNAGCEGLEGKYVAQGNQAKAELARGNTEFNASNKHNNVKKLQNHHPTVKPVALMQYLINMVAPKGGIVLDPFAGSGTTGLAARYENRNYVLIEISKEYCEIAQKRLKPYLQQTTMEL